MFGSMVILFISSSYMAFIAINTKDSWITNLFITLLPTYTVQHQIEEVVDLDNLVKTPST